MASCKRATSDPRSTYFRGPIANQQFSCRHCSSPCHVNRAQRLPCYISSGFAAYHLGHPYNRNRGSSSSLHHHAIGHYTNRPLDTTKPYCQSASPDDTGSTPFNRWVEPLLDQRIHRASSSQALLRDGGTHIEDPRGPSTHQEESPTYLCRLTFCGLHRSHRDAQEILLPQHENVRWHH